MPGFVALDPHNYQIGKGFGLFTPTGGTRFPLGNCPKIVYSPKVDVLDHYSSTAGTKVLDASTITQKGGELAVDMDEITVNNLSLFYLGSVDTTNPDAVKIGIFDKLSQIEGQFEFYQTNDVGPRYYMNLTRVLISPTGQFNPISDAYNAMTVTMKHVIDINGTFGFNTLLPDVSTIAPENLFAPVITGTLKQGLSPAFAQVGEIMTCNKGVWVGVQSYSFQWYSDGHAIANATGQTYTPVADDVGTVLTCDVTATNTVGSTSALSGGTLAVHA